MGLAAFGMIMSMLGNREALESAGMNEAQQELLNATPPWVNVAFGLAVIGGTLGCLCLVMKKKIAVPILTLSLLGVLAQNTYVFFMSNSVELMGVGLAPLVILIAIGLVPFSLFGAAKNWLK